MRKTRQILGKFTEFLSNLANSNAPLTGGQAPLREGHIGGQGGCFQQSGLNYGLGGSEVDLFFFQYCFSE